MCFPSLPIFIPDIDKLEKWINGDLGITEIIEATKKAKILKDITDEDAIFYINQPSNPKVGLKPIEKTSISSMLESLKPYMEMAKLAVDVLSTSEEVLAIMLGIVNPCYLSCTTTHKKNRNSKKLKELSGFLKQLNNKVINDKENIKIERFKNDTRPAECPTKIYFAFLDQNGQKITPPGYITNSGNWYGQFDLIRSKQELAVIRNLEINSIYQNKSDVIKSLKGRTTNNLDSIIDEEWNFKTVYNKADKPLGSKDGNRLYQEWMLFLYNNNYDIGELTNNLNNNSNGEIKKLNDVFINWSNLLFQSILDPRVITVNGLNKIQIKNTINVNNNDTNFQAEKDILNTQPDDLKTFFDDSVIITDINNSTQYDKAGNILYKDQYYNAIKPKIVSDRNTSSEVKIISLDEPQEDELSFDKDGNIKYPINAQIEDTDFYIDPVNYDITYRLFENGTRILIEGNIKETKDENNKKKASHCGINNYAIIPLPIRPASAIIVLVKKMLPKLLDLIELVISTLKTLLDPKLIVDFLIKILKPYLEKNFESFNKEIKNKKTKKVKSPSIKKDKKRSKEFDEDESEDSSEFMFNEKFILAGIAFIDLGFIKFVIELDNNVDIKIHYNDLEKFKDKSEHPILKLLTQLVSSPIKLIIDTFKAVLEILKGFLNPVTLVKAMPEFLSFKWLLDLLNPLNLLDLVGFGEILCLLGYNSKYKDHTTQIIPIPPLPNPMELITNRYNAQFPIDIPNLSKLLKCKKFNEKDKVIENNTNDTNQSNPNIVDNNSFSDLPLGYSFSDILAGLSIPSYVPLEEDVVITDINGNTKYTAAGTIQYIDKSIPPLTISGNGFSQKDPIIEKYLIEQKNKPLVDLTFDPNALLDKLKKEDYKIKSEDVIPKLGEYVLDKPKELILEYKDIITSILSDPKVLLTLGPLNIIETSLGFFNLIIQFINELIQMPIGIMGLDFLKPLIEKLKIPDIPNPIEVIKNNLFKSLEDQLELKN